MAKFDKYIYSVYTEYDWSDEIKQNWRPISLLKSEYKIGSKAFSLSETV